MKRIGRVVGLVRYPVKSMAGIPADSAFLGWHGLEGDRRFAFRRVGEAGGMPWLTASQLPELILYCPAGLDPRAREPLPTRVRTPDGTTVALRSPGLVAELARRYRGNVELMRLDHGIFDETPVSVISLTTIAGIGREAGLDLDRRRFRANIFVETDGGEPFLEDEWVGRTLEFGADGSGPAVSVTRRDERCVMVNLDPDTAKPDARIMKAVARLNGNHAGVYATALRCGTIRVGDRITLLPA